MADTETEQTQSCGEDIKIEVVGETVGEPEVEVPEVSNTPLQRKKVKDLSDQERQKLIDDARQGRESEDFNVKFFKNGSARITHKKVSKSQQLISATPTQGVPRTVLTNDQLMMEHIIDLESKFTKMTMKHKKLKKRYAELESNIYYDDSVGGENPVGEIPDVLPEEPPTETVGAPVTNTRRARGWRARLA